MPLTANGGDLLLEKFCISQFFDPPPKLIASWARLLYLCVLQYVEYRHLIQASFRRFPYGISVYYPRIFLSSGVSIVVWIASQSLKAPQSAFLMAFPGVS